MGADKQTERAVTEKQTGADANEAMSQFVQESQAESQSKPNTFDKGVCAVGLAAWGWLTVDTAGLAAPALLAQAYLCRNEIKDVLGIGQTEKKQK